VCYLAYRVGRARRNQEQICRATRPEKGDVLYFSRKFIDYEILRGVFQSVWMEHLPGCLRYNGVHRRAFAPEPMNQFERFYRCDAASYA
jgi:hypothetical protein